MVVAEQKPRLHQVVARSTGDMLATLRQATGRNKRAICKEEKGGRLAPAASGNFVLLDLEYSKFSDVSNEDNETDSLASGKQNAEYHYQRGAGQGHQEDREEDEEEALRRVPLLENDHNIHRGQSRWKSCGWSGDGQHELDCREQDKEHEVTRIGRSASRKSLMESLFSHSSIVNQTKNCDSSNTTTIRNKKDSNSNSNINRDKFHAHQKHRKQHHHPQHNCKHEEENHASQCEDELFLARKDDEVESGGDVEVVVHQGSCCDNNSNTKKKKKPEQCFNGEINNLQQSEKDFSSSPSSSANKRSMKLLSLLSHDDHHDHGEQDHGEHSPEFKGPSFGGQKDADAKERRGRRGEREWKRSSSSSSRFNDGEASSVAQEAIMTSCEFPATTIGNCNRSIEQQQQHHELGERNEKQQRKNQLKKQQLAAAAARKLASSSPILTPTTPNDNYDATADCFGRSNKEPCDATGPTATCDNKKHSSAALLSLLGGGGADEALELSLREKRQHRQQKLASVANVATRNGQVTLTKLPRVERARTQKQLQTAASLKNQRLRSQQQQQPWSSSSLARLANNGQRQSSGPLEPIGARQPLTDRNQLSACPSQDLVVGVATPVSASSLEYFGYSQAGHRHHDEAQQKKKKEKLLPHLASVGSTDGHLNSLELVETASVASPAGLGGHEKHYDDQETADGNDSHLAAQQHNTGELTTAGTGNSAKNNAHELSPGFGFGLASNATTTTTTTKSRSKSEDAAGGGQREAANHPGQRLLSAANAGQLALLLASQGRRLQDSQKQQLEQQQQPPPARRTVTNGMVTAPPSPQLACQLNNGNEHQDHRVEERDDDENGGRNRLSCLVSMDGGQCTGASQNDIRWRDGGVNGCGSQGVEDNCDERRHASSVHQSEPATNAGRRRSERERDDDDQEQIGSGGREGFSVVEIEAPEQMSSDRDQRASWRGQSKEQQQQPEQRQMHRETHDSDYNNGKSVTTRLVDTCASSWRQAALMASPVLSNLAGGSHSGSYKVAQRQRRHQHQVTTAATTSSNPSSQQTNQKRDGNNATGANQYGTSASSKGQDFAEKLACYSLAQVQQRQEQQQREQYQQQTQQGTTTTNTTTNTTTTTASCKQHDRNSRSASQRRLSRPGRSPISLQRQTNARLARHRLKIQQQRQEQLASLALREREQFSREARQQLVQQLYNRQGQLQSQSAVSRTVTVLGNGASGSTISQTNSANNELEIEILPPLEQQRARRYQQRANQISSSSSGKGSLLRDLFERLSGRRSSSPSSSNNELQHQQQNPNSPSGSRATAVALVDFSSQQSSRVLGPRSGHHNSQQQETPSRQSVAIQLCDSNYLNNSRDRHRQAWNSASQRGQRIVSTNMQQLSSGGNHNNNTRAQRQTQSHQMSSKRSSADSAFDSTTTNSSSLSSSSSTSSSASSSTLSLNKPFCKICHLSSTRNGSDKLISPCKCSGTMQYIHCGCLLKWLEISNRTNEKPISCELCSHEYTWHKRFNYRHMKLPKCSTKDILLHMIFVLALGGMLFCALAPLFNRSVRSSSSSSSSMTISDFNSMSMEQAAQQVIPRSREISFGSDHHINKPQQQQQQDRLASNIRPSSLRSHSSGLSTSALPASSSSPNASGRLANDEKFILICAAFFFISFFIAIYTQTNTRDTLYGLIVKFTNMNLTYYITEYDHGITTTNNTETTTKTTTSATRDNNDESPNDRSRMNTTHNYSNHHQHQTSEQNIDISQQQQQQQQQQHSNGAINSNNKGRVVNKHLYGQSHSLNNGRKASV